jgi:glycosyltransferase involved in cell wall biosynthesis
MRIGLNLLPLAPNVTGGAEWYVRNLIHSLAELDERNDFVLFTNRNNHETFGPDSALIRRFRCEVYSSRQAGRVLFEQIYLPRLAKRLSLDVLHSPFYTSPIYCNRPTVVTIADMLYKVHPQWVGQARLTFRRVFVPLSARHCKRILTFSENSKRDIVRFLHVSPGKVVVTPLAADAEFSMDPASPGTDVERITRSHGIESPYILNVGGLGLHKNTPTLVEAFHEYAQRYQEPRLQLVLAGRDYGARRSVEAQVQRLGLQQQVIFLDYVPRQDLPVLYRGASLYVSVSFFEGFGLTPLEAMSCGTPVITSTAGSLPEVVRGAGLMVEPDDVKGLADAIARVAQDPRLRSKLSQQGTARAKEFSWRHTAERTLDAYRATAGT